MPGRTERHDPISDELKSKLVHKEAGYSSQVNVENEKFSVEQYRDNDGIYLTIIDQSGHLLAYVRMMSPTIGDDEGPDLPRFWNVVDTRTDRSVWKNGVVSQIITAWIKSTRYILLSDLNQTDAGAGVWKQLIKRGEFDFFLYKYGAVAREPIKYNFGTINPDPWSDPYENHRIMVCLRD
ncbi:hypothetical protein [Methylobacterium aquaticum]|uniref:Uncharacterized protein n=1 Tax=Methylobacterium aquaticum TaxID=270351 RepID=A0A0C6FC10_9HYPH|nr:hypothetical protein [Methylobacterium aquaticum]BAQ44382.1 hypothetical protein Maq22A_c04895 [Methylobacterium aquaticum]